MTQVGATQISFRGVGPWRGMTTQSRAQPFGFELLENCYVSSDGSEIRMVPGFVTYADLTAARAVNGDTIGGFRRDVIDARRPVYAATGSYNFQDASVTETMKVWAPPTHVHGFDFVSGRMILFGEIGPRLEPIKDSGAGNTYVYVTAVTYIGAGVTELTLNTAYYIAGGFQSAGVAGTAATLWRIYLIGITGGPATTLCGANGLGKAHVVGSYPTATTIRITTDIGSAANNVIGQTAYIARVTRDYAASNTETDDNESLAIWTLGTIPTSLPIQSCNPAWVANLQRDFGDTAGFFDEGGRDGCSRRRSRSIPYRIVPHVAGNRLIMVAPGYNCVFQAPVTIPLNYEGANTNPGISWVSNDVYDKPRCVGVPKAIMYIDNVRTHTGGSVNTYAPGAAASAFGGTDHPERTGVYKFAVAYKDEVTGEIGLLSETVDITTDNSAAKVGVRLVVVHPGYVLPECLALSVLVYRSEKNGETLYYDHTAKMDAFFTVATSPRGTLSAKYGVAVSTAVDSYQHCIEILVPYQTDEILKSNAIKSEARLPIIEQMPMGAKAARTVRGGWTIYGGALGNRGARFELFASDLSLYYDKNSPITAAGAFYPDNDLVFSRFATESSSSSGLTAHGSWGTGLRGIPPAYAGQQVTSRSLFPFPRETVILDRIVNNEANYDSGVANGIPHGQMREIRWKTVDSPVQPGIDTARDTKTTYMLLPRGRLQISEADNPGVTPATNTTVISKEAAEDIEGIGEANGQMVVCTRSKTYVVGYGTSPVGVPGEMASDQFGCIAANSMVSFDLGCAWISDRGPCAILGGAFAWIGEPIQHLFTGESARYLRDSQGMMRHSWAAHDPDRGLIYFGLYANRNTSHSVVYRGNSGTWTGWGTALNDEAQSRFPCDEVLIYSYKAGAWSVWRPPTSLFIKWMAHGPDQNGVPRMFFLGSDDRVYVLDDDYAQWNENAIVCSVTADSSTTVVATDGTFATDVTARGNGTFWAAGMDVLVIWEVEGRPLMKKTTLVSVTASTVTLADAVVVATGDTLVIGGRTATIKTNFMTFKAAETARAANMGMRYSLDGDTDGVAYVRGDALTTQIRDTEPASVTSTFTSQDSGDSYLYLGANDDTDRTMDRRLSQGALQGSSPTRMEYIVSGNASVRIQDIYAEIQ